ncbi:nuclear pore complex protein Nup98-Nup96 isoform X2 [Bacillus rossius redtenbacheri]|uniref:nuclear pore complex protein Nup98-Nup96 isoform X2 n=1 Tax=Bacillus rossius redtenbacheri TaxID=93214 RepID=UPI002FDEB1C0
MFPNLKPAFGQQTATPAFGSGFTGATSASPFGASTTFGKTPTTGFGTPAFGSTSTPLFGSSTQNTGGLFGQTATPVFGQTQTTQPSFGGFGSNTSGGLFGAQPNANTGGLFSNTGSSAFGQSKPAFGGFGSSIGTGLFGQTQQTQAQTPGTTSLFGQSSGTTSTGLFGSGGFGVSTNATAAVGTPLKFNPVTGTDTMVKNGVSQTINTRHHCITCMKEYESKSLEELRMEDYAANRKGPQQATQAGGLFGGAAQPLFGGASTSTAGTSGMFGEKSLFGSTTGMGFGSSPGFGSTTQSGGLFSKPPQFGALATTSSTGFSFNTTTTANPFGAAAQAKPFGAVAPQQSNLFGTPASQPSTGFGTTNFGFSTQPNQSIGLFNQNKPFSLNTTSTGFSFGQNTVTNTGSLFGAKPGGTTSFGTFGSTPSTGFGATGTSLFNQPFKPASTGFTFNQTGATNTGGLNLGGQPSLFNNPANKPGGLFGTTGSLFGSGGLGTGSTFGTGTGLGGSALNFGTTTMLGGANAGLQTSQQPNNQIHQQIMALASMPFGDSPLFRNLLPATGKTEELLKSSRPITQKDSPNQFKVTPKGTSKVKVRPIGITTTTKNSLFDGIDDEDALLATTFRPKTNSVRRLLIKPKPNNDSSDAVVTGSSPSFAYRTAQAGSDKENEPDTSTIGSSRKLSWLQNHSAQASPSEELHPEEKGKSNSPNKWSPGNDENNVVLTDTISDLRLGRNNFGADSRRDRKISGSSSDESVVVEDIAPLSASGDAHPAGIVLRRAEYYTIPSLAELATLVAEDGSCVVDNFTVGREGYGNVYFPDSFDVAGLNLDEIVHFRHKEVTLYPDDDNKPPVGQGLNRRAQVTLDRVWPMDKAKRKPIVDPERLAQMGYEEKLLRVCAKLNTRFLDYRPQTGSWVFKVDHFSKYALSESDEEDDPPDNASKPKKATILVKKHETSIAKDVSRHGLSLVEDDQDMEDSMFKTPEHDFGDLETAVSPTSQLARHVGASPHMTRLMKASLFMDDDDDDELQNDLEAARMTNSAFGSLLRVRTSKQQAMEDVVEELEVTPVPGSIIRSKFTTDDTKIVPHVVKEQVVPVPTSPLPMTLPTWVPVPTTRPTVRVLKHQHERVHLAESMCGRVGAACFADVSLMMGWKFGASWGPAGSFVTLTTRNMAAVVPLRAGLLDLGAFTCGRPQGDYSPCIVQRLRLTGGDCYSLSGSFQETVEGHLEVQLKNSVLKMEEECPLFSPSPGLDALDLHSQLANQLQEQAGPDRYLTYCAQVLQLCVALWGSLPLSGEEVSAHQKALLRREAVSQWLQEVVSPRVEQETAEIQQKPSEDVERHIPAVLSLLSAYKIKEACDQLQNAGDHVAAMLLSLTGSTPKVNKTVQQCLADWNYVELDYFVNPKRLRMFLLVSGMPIFSSKHGMINVFKNLDWKRTFAVHLWYMCSRVATVVDALLLYEEAFRAQDTEPYACPPHPPYVEDDLLHVEVSSGRPVWDLCFHLLKLYSDHSYPLQQMLNPSTHTPDPLDYRLSWLVMVIMDAIGYSNLSEYCAAQIHTSFASQLESHGLWHWAVFVLLHLKQKASRKAAVLEVLGRHVELNTQKDYQDKEAFVIEHLKIPKKWIFGSRATLALSQKRYKDAAWFLIQGELWKDSHDVIMEHIAADAIIYEDYEYLHELLQELAPSERSATISKWPTMGQVLWDFINMQSGLKRLLSEPDEVTAYHLEKLQYELANLCSRIGSLPVPTAKHTLCQVEIAERISALFRSLSACAQSQNQLRASAMLCDSLPLPGDYTQQALNQISSQYVLPS